MEKDHGLRRSHIVELVLLGQPHLAVVPEGALRSIKEHQGALRSIKEHQGLT
eukprot:SAG31_NODE_1984_length_6740_cov_4.949255_4_plen_52_part_00